MASRGSSGEWREEELAGSNLANAIFDDAISFGMLEQCAQEGCIDVPNEEGKTPLMMACLKGSEKFVKFLLESGANPNSKSLKDGNTPLHYACMVEDRIGKAYFHERIRNQAKWRTPQISTVKLLLKHGALIKNNKDGWSPVCVAAFYLLKDFVDFFMSMDDDGVSREDKIKASAILGVMHATLERHSPKDAFNSLFRAINLKEDAGLNKVNAYTSELAACFSKLSLKECHTLEEVRSVESSEDALKAHAFLVGERLFPLHLKQRYFFPALAYFAYFIMYLEENVERGFQIFSHVLDLERVGEAQPGTALLQFSYAFQFQRVSYSIGAEPQPLDRQLTMNMLSDYVTILKNVPIEFLLEVHHSLIQSFSGILFYDTMTSSDQHVLKVTLEKVENIWSVIRRRIHKETPNELINIPSLTFEVMSHVRKDVDLVLSASQASSVEWMLVKLRYLLLRLLQSDNASFQHKSSGNTILHMTAYSILSAVNNQCFKTCLKDLAQAIIRHGCPLGAVNRNRQTARDILLESGLKRSNFKQIEISLRPPSKVLELQEAAIREIFRHKISYKDKLPPRLHNMLEGVTDADLEITVLQRKK